MTDAPQLNDPPRTLADLPAPDPETAMKILAILSRARSGEWPTGARPE